MVAPFLPDAEKVRALREAIPGAAAGIYLNTATAGPLPSEVDAAMRGIRDWELRVGRGDAAAVEAALGRRDEARGVLAALCGASPDEIALTHGTVAGMLLAASAVPLRQGDIVVATDEEHPAVDVLLARLAARTGAMVERVAVVADHSRDEIAAAFDGFLRAGARLCLLPHVTWATGRRLPVEDVLAAAGRHEAWTIVDGALAAGAASISDVAAAADFYAFPGRKWLMAPGGTGALRIRERALRDLEPRGVGDRAEPAGEEGVIESATGARAWESGGWDDPVVAGLARAVGWLEMYVGLEWSFGRVRTLARELAARLATLPRVRLLAPVDEIAAVVSLQVEGWPATAVAEELRRRDFAILAAIPERNAVRLSVAAFNTDDELQRVVETVALVARHEPGTLPRRPSLVVLPSEP